LIFIGPEGVIPLRVARKGDRNPVYEYEKRKNNGVAACNHHDGAIVL